MNTTQLANVLIKVLGLSMIAHGIPAVINVLMTILIASGMGAQHGAWFPAWFAQISPAASLVIGFVLTVASRSITALLFKNDEHA